MPRESFAAFAAFAALSLLLAGGTGYLLLRETGSPPPAAALAVRIDQVVDSQVVEFEVLTNQPTYTLRLSDDVFAVDENGVIRSVSNWTYPGAFTTPGLFVPPGRTAIEVAVTTGPLSWNRTLDVAPGGDPVVSGQRAFETIDMLTTDYNGRYCGRDSDDGGARYLAAAEAMRDLMLEWGFDYAEVTSYNGPDSDDLQNVVGYKWGRLYPDEWLVFGGHFDVAFAGTAPGGGTWEGASDDTSGSTVSLELAEAIAARTWDRTVVAALWACEELGKLGSEKFVENLPENVTVKTYWNFDMVALNYPIQALTGADPYELGIQMGPDPTDDIDRPVMRAYLERTVYEILRYQDDPLAPFNFIEGESSGSDHSSFVAEGYPAYSFMSPGGDASFGQVWHSGTDTLDGMVAKARGEAALASGFNTLVWITFYLLVFLDNDDQVGRGLPG